MTAEGREAGAAETAPRAPGVVEPVTPPASAGALGVGEEALGWSAFVAAVALLWLWQGQGLVAGLGTLGADLACFTPIVAAGAWLAAAPARRRRALLFLDSACASPRRAALLVTLVLLGAVKVYAVPGFRELDGDGACHTTAARLVADTFAAREWPTWSNAWAMGFPFLQFYPPLFAWISGGLTWLTDDPRFAVRAVLALAHLASGWGAFALGRRLFPRPGAAIVCAIGYALTPWHLFEVFHWNRFPTALIWALWPWVLWIFERGRDGARWVFGCASLLAVAALAHHGAAFFVGELLGLWALLRWLEQPDAVQAARAGLRALAAAGALAVALVAFFVLPYALESKLTFEPPGLGGVRFDFDQPHLATVLWPARRPVGHSGYLGLALVLPGWAGAALASLRRQRGRWATVGCLGYAWLLALGHDLPIYPWIPFAKALFFGGRYLIFVALFLALGLGHLWCWLEERGWWSSPSTRAWARATALLVLLADLGGTTFTRYRHPYPAGRTGEARRQAFESLGTSAGMELGTRVLELPDAPRDYLWSALLPLTARHATAAPGLWGTLRSGMYFFRGWVDVDEAWHANPGSLAPGSLDRLALSATRTLLATRAGPTGDSTRVTVDLGSRTGWVIAASRWRPMSDDLELPSEGWERPFGVDSTPPGAWDRIVAAMAIDRDSATARTLIVRRELPLLGEPGPDDEPARPRLTVEKVHVTPTTVTVDLDLDRAAYLRFAQSYYPHQRVRLDGHRTDAVPDVTHATVIAAPAGQHTVRFEGGSSWLRRILGALSFSVLCAAAGFEVRARVRARRHP
ncbi:MAG: 6-pyruvoyl-tetrahydropterin synthase-related protein [bacterium]